MKKKTNRKVKKVGGIMTMTNESKASLDLEGKLTSRKILGIEFDMRRLHDKKYVVKKIYQMLEKANYEETDASPQWRVMAVQYLEKELKADFKLTRVMRQKVKEYLGEYKLRKVSIGKRIIKARKKRKLTQKELAKELGYKSHVPIAYFEKDLRYPPDKVIRWLEDEEM